MHLIIDKVKPNGMPMSVFIDVLILELPDLIENRYELAQDIKPCSTTMDEYPELTRADEAAAQARLVNKRREFSSVVCQVEHLRQVIRQYYRNTSV